jgi:FMN-dependent NADH-azoreductase
VKNLVITASIRGDESVSRILANKLAAQLGGDIIDRDLTKEIDFVSAESFAAAGTPKEERTPAQSANATTQLADRLIEELQEADNIIFGAPIYNFGVPASLKAWADLVARAGTTFRYTENGPEGLLTGKKAYIMAVSGGVPVGSDMDFMSSWLKFFLGFLGITDVEVISADGIMGQDGEEKIQAAHKAVENMAA